MSKSHTTKEADNKASPILIPGDCCPNLLATVAFQTLSSSCSAAVNGPIWRGLESVKHFLKKFFDFAEFRGFSNLVRLALRQLGMTTCMKMQQIRR